MHSHIHLISSIFIYTDRQTDNFFFLFSLFLHLYSPKGYFCKRKCDKFSLIWILTKGKKKKASLNITTGIHNTTLIFIITIMHNMARMLCLFLWVMQNLDRSHFLPLQLSQLEFCCCAMLHWHCTGS